MTLASGQSRRGAPIMVLAAITLGWVGTRAAIWENPFPVITGAIPELFAEGQAPARPAQSVSDPTTGEQASQQPVPLAAAERRAPVLEQFAALSQGNVPFAKLGTAKHYSQLASTGMNPNLAFGHQRLWSAALGQYSKVSGNRLAGPSNNRARPSFRQAPVLVANGPRGAGRWSLDSWAFWRQGSNGAAISQGRTPIYGASQVGASLQYRLAASSGRDPRLYVRAYRALVSNGESELAVGASARPITKLPLRAHAEVRVTHNTFGTELRPAGFVVTEIAPQRLPAGFVAEAYGQAGYVGGSAATGFADGQLAVTREMRDFKLSETKRARLSVGAGAWGGAQRDASRVDLGPTLRLDLTIGAVPARISVDWREQVAGDASPGSGLAATVSTRF